MTGESVLETYEPERFRAVEAWTEAAVLGLPEQETDAFEFKSSLIREHANYPTELKAKICKTASAMWNTGGGVLFVGVDDNGRLDGGVPATMGKMALRDWVDQVLTSVVPIGPYATRTIAPESIDSQIDKGHVVLVIGFGDSHLLPHMAPDQRYYVRAGAHSVPAGHYLVEAMRARRGQHQPMLRGLLRSSRSRPHVLELAVLAVNEVPAVDIAVDFSPMPAFFAEGVRRSFPLRIPVIDQRNPLMMNVATSLNGSALAGDEPLVELVLTYHNIAGRRFEERHLIDPYHDFQPVSFEDNKTEKALRRLSKQLTQLMTVLQSDTDPADEA
jgi:hypothetical protein